MQIAPENFFDGLLAYLKGKKEPGNDRTFNHKILSKLDLIKAITTKPTVSNELIQFEMRCEALTVYCSSLLKGAKKELAFSNPEECQVVEHAIQVIMKDAESLKTAIGPERYRKLEATQTEITHAISKFKIQEVPEPGIESRAKTLNMHPQMLQTLRDVMVKSGVSAESLKGVRQTLCWVLGDEIGELIDALEDAVGELPPSTVPPPVKTEKKEEGWLRTILFSVYFKIAIALIRIAYAYAKVQEYTLSVVLQPILPYILEYIIPQPIQDWYAQVMAAVHRKIAEFVISLTLKCLVSNANAQELYQGAMEWRTAIQSWSKTLAGSFNISYDVDPAAIKPVNMDDAYFVIKESKKKLNGVDDEGQRVVPIYEKIPFPDSKEPITAATLIPTVKQWLVHAQELRDANEGANKDVNKNTDQDTAAENIAFAYLIQNIQRLEIPTNIPGFWDTIPNKQECLEAISDLGVAVASYSNSKPMETQLIGNYTILAIIDKLVRDDPTLDIKGSNVSITPILHWLNRGDGVIRDFAALQRFKQIMAYLAPDIDITNPPSDKEIGKIGKKSLFDYSFRGEEGFFGKSYNFIRSSPGVTMKAKAAKQHPEFQYLMKVAQDPALNKKIEALGIKVQLSEHQKIGLLLNEGFVFTRGDKALLPRSYALLCLQALICNNVSLTNYSLKHLKNIKTTEAQVPKMQEETKSFDLSYRPDGLFYAFDPKNKEDYFHGFYYAKDLLKKPAKTQSEAMAIKKADSDTNLLMTQLREMIRCERSDQIVRSLAFYQTHKTEFKNDSDLSIQFFENMLFKVGMLEKQLQESPRIAKAIGEALTEILEHNKTLENWNVYTQLIHTGMQLQKYCNQVAPQFSSSFPNFQILLKHTPKDALADKAFTLLRAISVDRDSCKNESEKEKAVVAICEAHFKKLNWNESTLICMLQKFKMVYWEWLSTIKEMLKNEEQRTRILNAILESKGIKIPEGTVVKWTEDSNKSGLYTYNSYSIDFVNKIIVADGTNVDSIVQTLSTGLAYITGEAGTVHAISDHEYESADKSIVIELKDGKAIFKKKMNEKEFHHILGSSIECNNIEKYVSTMKNNIVCWIENTPSAIKEVIVHSSGKPVGHFSFEKNESNGQHHLKKIYDEGTELHLLDGDALSPLLGSLKKFCPLKEIKCWKKAGENQISKIDIEKYNLQFTQQLYHGHSEAMSKEFPGYMIAKDQNHPSLHDIPSNVLLVNQHGKKKVLIPDNQLMSAGVWRFLSQLGPLAHLAHEWLEEFAGKNSSAYYVYDLDDKNQLTSEDGKSLAYLLMIYIANGNSAQAMRVCSLLESLCKQRSMDVKAISNLLLPLACVPPNFGGIIHLRQRILAVIEENRLVQCNGGSSKEQVEELNAQDKLWIITAYWDLMNCQDEKDPRKKLSDDQEWFLFQGLFHRIHSIKKEFLGTSRINPALETSLELAILTPQLSRRYELLKKKFGKEESLLVKPVRYATNVLKTPSALPRALPILDAQRNNSFTHFVQAKSYYSNFSQETIEKTVDLQKKELRWPIGGNPPLTFIEIMKPGVIAKHFFSYYAIARGSVDNEQRKKLGELLPLLKGGLGTPESAILIEYLEAVYQTPKLFWKIDSLKKIWELKTTKNKWKDRLKVVDTFKSDAYKLVNKPELETSKNSFFRCLFNDETWSELTEAWKKFKNSHSLYQNEKDAAKRIDCDAHNAIIWKEFLKEAIWNKYESEPWEYLTCACEMNDKNDQIWKGFFNQLHRRSLAYHLTKQHGSAVVESVLTEYNASNLTSAIFDIGSQFTSWMTSWASEAINLGGKVYQNHVDSKLEMQNKIKSLPVHLDASYASLIEEDRNFDAQFNELFSLAFEKVKTEKRSALKGKVQKFKRRGDKGTKERFDRVNASLDKFYDATEEQPLFKLKDPEAIWDLYQMASSRCRKIEQLVNAEREQLLKCVNLQRNANFTTPLSFEDLKNFLVKGEFDKLGSGLELSPQSLQQLELALARHCVRTTRLQQMQRIEKHLEGLIPLDPSTQSSIYKGKIEQVAKELQVRRTYDFANTPPRLLRRYLVFELSTETMLWKEQADSIKNLLLGNHGDAVLELLMSLGKTFFGIPTIDSFEADGTKVVFNIWPSAMAGTNIRQITSQSKNVFDQTVNVLKFSRSSKLDDARLDAVFTVISRAMKNGETINMTREDVQALELIFLDKLNKDGKATESTSALWKLKLILALIKKHGKAMGDEAHELFDDRQELNYPIGPPSIIKTSYYEAMEKCYATLIEIPGLLQKLRSSEISKLDEEELDRYLKVEVMPHIAQQLSMDISFKIYDAKKRKEFVDYVTGKLDYVPEWISKSTRCSEISMVKGALTILMPLALKRQVNVDFGPTQKDSAEEREFALPYEGNRSPNEQSTIRNPYEAITKTLTMFVVNGLTEKQLKKLINVLRMQMQKEMSTRNIKAHETAAYKTFKEICKEKCPNADLMQLSTLYNADGSLNSDLYKALSHSRASLLYVKYFVRNKILYWKENLCSNTQNFGSMFNSQWYDTGTPFNDGVYPSKMKVLWNETTIGQALDIISKKCPKDGIHLLKSEQPEEILEEILQNFFKHGTGFTALIDGGAQLHGLSNQWVAQRMLEYCKLHRNDIKAIDFFMRDKDGKDLLMSWERGAAEPVPYDMCKLPPEARLSYFDQRHGFAANIPQKFNGKGLNLPGRGHQLYRLLQEVFRMRGLKGFLQLLENGMTLDDLEAQNLQNSQTIHFALTPAVKKLINPNGNPTLRDIFIFCIKNEGKETARHNYSAYRQKISNVIRRTCMDKLLNAKSKSEMRKIFKSIRDVVISKMDDDPKVLFGSINKSIPTDEALKSAKERAVKLSDKISCLSREEKMKIKKDLEELPAPPMPEQVRVYVGDGKEDRHVMDDLEKEVNQEQETDMDQEMENETHTEQCSQVASAKFKETAWNPTVNRDFIHKLKFSSLESTCNSTLYKTVLKAKALWDKFAKKLQAPPLFRVQDALMHSKVPALADLAQAVDERLWMSNNFLPLFVNSLTEQPADICSEQQRELFEVLVHAEELPDGSHRVVSMGGLSQKEMAFWREKLRHPDPTQDGKQKIFLYDTTLRQPVAGDVNWNIEELIESDDFSILEGQFKILQGEVNLPFSQVSKLRKWKTATNPESLKESLHYINSLRGRTALEGSNLETLIAVS